MNESVCERLPFYTTPALKFPVLKLIGMQQLDKHKCRKSKTKESRGVVSGMPLNTIVSYFWSQKVLQLNC